MSGLFPSIIYLANKWLWGTRFFALLGRASRGRSKLFVSLQLGLQIRMSLPAWRPVQPLFLSTGRLLYIIWKLGPLITSSCRAKRHISTCRSCKRCAWEVCVLLIFAARNTPTFWLDCHFDLRFKKTRRHLVTSLGILIVVDLWRNKGSTWSWIWKYAEKKGWFEELPCAPKEPNYFWLVASDGAVSLWLLYLRKAFSLDEGPNSHALVMIQNLQRLQNTHTRNGGLK